MIEAMVFSALIFVCAALLIRGASLLWLHVLPVIRQYRIIKREG